MITCSQFYDYDNDCLFTYPLTPQPFHLLPSPGTCIYCMCDTLVKVKSEAHKLIEANKVIQDSGK